MATPVPPGVETDSLIAQKLTEGKAKSSELEKNAEKTVTALAPDDSTPLQLVAATDKMISQSAKLDDFYQLGRYTYIVCLFAELLILAQVFIKMKDYYFLLRLVICFT